MVDGAVLHLEVMRRQLFRRRLFKSCCSALGARYDIFTYADVIPGYLASLYTHHDDHEPFGILNNPSCIF